MKMSDVSYAYCPVFAQQRTKDMRAWHTSFRTTGLQPSKPACRVVHDSFYLSLGKSERRVTTSFRSYFLTDVGARVHSMKYPGLPWK